MAFSLEALVDQIETTEDVRSIVRTMKSLSIVSIRQFERVDALLSEHEATIELGLQACLLATNEGFRQLALTPARGAARRAVVAFGSDRGLCGRYNEAAAEATLRVFASDETDPTIEPFLCVVGARLAQRLQALGRRPDAILSPPSVASGVTRLAQSLLLAIDAQSALSPIERVDAVWTDRNHDRGDGPDALRLAPLARGFLSELLTRRWPSRRAPMALGAPERCFSAFARQHLFIRLCRCAASSVAAEHAARLAAMQSAERGVDERLDRLSRAYRTTRQEAITIELLDVVSGFEAGRTE